MSDRRTPGPKRYASSTAFTDLLFNIVVGVTFLFMLAFLLINPVTKKNNVESKADYLIILSWDKNSENDIDLWIRDPLNKLMSFKSKDVGFMHLDRDDLGSRNDKITMPDGTVKFIKENREIAALRGTIPGEYTINVHAYRKRDDKEVPVKVELIRVNPYRLLQVGEFIITRQGQEHSVFQFRMNDAGVVTGYSDRKISLIRLGSSTLDNSASDDLIQLEHFFNQWNGNRPPAESGH